MKIAISVGLLLGLTQYAAAFPCTWNGAGSSYVYHDVDTGSVCCCTDGFGNCIQTCLNSISNQWQQTSCCRCASRPECEQVPPNDDFVGGGPSNWWGCDLYAPDINIADAVEAASAPGMWFTSKDQLEAYLEATVSCTDDCSPEPTCEKAVSYTAGGVDRCGNTYVTVTSRDRESTCVNANYDSKSFYVRFDEQAPVVTVTLGNYVDKKSAKTKFEDIPLSITVTDNCDPNPELTITVFSDEKSVSHDYDDKPVAVLERKYSNTGASGVLTGWGLTLDRVRYAKKLCGPGLECQEADGRFYIVRVCAKDRAGLWSCAEDSVGVPLKPTELKHIVPENQGKLFIVAEDAGFYDMAPTEIPFRNENTDLNVEPAYQKARLCWANYGIRMDQATQIGTTITGVNNDQCWRQCGTTAGCIGYTYNFNSVECKLYSAWGGLILAATGMPNIFLANNIYAMDNERCPAKDVTYTYF